MALLNDAEEGTLSNDWWTSEEIFNALNTMLGPENSSPENIKETRCLFHTE